VRKASGSAPATRSAAPAPAFFSSENGGGQ
jgi:hypothetical protein